MLKVWLAIFVSMFLMYSSFVPFLMGNFLLSTLMFICGALMFIPIFYLIFKENDKQGKAGGDFNKRLDED